MGASISNATLDERRAEWSIPSWCIGGSEANVTPDISRLVQESWAQVMHSDSDTYRAAHDLDHTLTPITFFYDRFYAHLFDWCPEVRKMFTRGIRAQGQMLANVIKFIVDNIGVNEKEFKANLTMLAKVHNGRGITANHYSVMGMTLIHTIRYCIGEKHFTDAHRRAWVVVYSRMMIVMIPVVVSGETIDSDYLIAKAERDSIAGVSGTCPATNRRASSEYSQCPSSRKSSVTVRERLKNNPAHQKDSISIIKPAPVDNSPHTASPHTASSRTASPHTPGQKKGLTQKLSIQHSSRTSVSVISAMSAADSDSDL